MELPFFRNFRGLHAGNCHKKITIKGLRDGFEITKFRLWNLLNFSLGREQSDTRAPESQVVGCLKSEQYSSFSLPCFLESQVGPG